MSHHLVGVTEVATLLGVSRQRVHQLSESAADFPNPEAELSAGKVWSRSAIETWVASHPERVGDSAARGALSEFSEDALHLLVRAEDEARQLNHDFLGTEHLLIALVSMDSGRVPASLATLSLGRTQVLDEVLTAVPRGAAAVTGRPAFTPRTFRTLNAAVELSKREGRDKAEPRDVFLALLEDADGVATKVLLRRSGARSLDALRRQMRAALEVEDDPLAVANPGAAPRGSDALVRCTFCNKTQKELKKLIAGPGVYICDECIALCQAIIDEDAAGAAAAQPIAEQLHGLARDIAAIAVRLESK